MESNRASLWKFADIDELVRLEAPESLVLELKRGLQTADGAQGWIARSRIHGSERDGLAKEIVALANTYGGSIVVGVEESADAPKRAATMADPLPNIFELVDRLRTSLASVIDPPIQGLEIAAIPTAEDSKDGYIVVTTPPSAQKPHGVGTPPQVYVRREDRSEPASMREIQNMFWEARTDRERIGAELDRRIARFREIAYSGDFAFHFVAVASRPLSMYRLARAIREGKLINDPPTRTLSGDGDAAEFPRNVYRWQPTSQGVEYKEKTLPGQWYGDAVWEIDETGVVAVWASNTLDTGREANKWLLPGEYAKSAGYLLALTNIISRWTGYAGTWSFSSRFLGPPKVEIITSQNAGRSQSIDLSEERFFRPFSLSSYPSNDEMEAIADRIWETFGQLRPPESQHLQHGYSEGLAFGAQT